MAEHRAMNFEEMLADRDFGLRMRFTRGEVAAFFMPGASHGEVIAERRRWIAAAPEVHCAMMEEGHAMMEETVALAASLGTLPEGECEFGGLDPLGRCRKLGGLWEADFLLMKPDAAGVFRLYGGCLCFPSHWDLRDKLGLPMADIHAPVPGLNGALGQQIDGFLRRIKPGISWERANWGLSRTSELNLHPSRKLPRLDAGVSLDEVWFRIEEQSLVALPLSGGILFGIRLVIVPLRDIKADATHRHGMIRALRTMPEPMAGYKGIAPARERLIALMEGD
jgi:dimethylamine monooxygenase subunit A